MTVKIIPTIALTVSTACSSSGGLDLVARVPPDWSNGLFLALSALILGALPLALVAGGLAMATRLRAPRTWAPPMNDVVRVGLFVQSSSLVLTLPCAAGFVILVTLEFFLTGRFALESSFRWPLMLLLVVSLASYLGMLGWKYVGKRVEAPSFMRVVP
jgi:hypothetical protein